MKTRRPTRKLSREFKQQAVERMKTCACISDLARELDVERKQLYKWRVQLEGRGEAKYPGQSEDGRPSTEFQLRQQNQQLAEALARKVVEADFFRSALRKIEAASSGKSGGPALTPKSGQECSSKAD